MFLLAISTCANGTPKRGGERRREARGKGLRDGDARGGGWRGRDAMRNELSSVAQVGRLVGRGFDYIK